jgi:hypothetical protein
MRAGQKRHILGREWTIGRLVVSTGNSIDDLIVPVW